MESEFMGPAADLNTLAESGICPAGSVPAG